MDIHTHAPTHDPRIKEVLVLDPRIPAELSLQSAQCFCQGLHPWFIDETDENIFFSGLKTGMQIPGFFALGEIGLDRVNGPDWEVQTRVFKKQLEYAQTYRIERIVLHCVKAYFDVLPELKKLRHAPAIIFHDFNANLETAEKLMSALNVYFSFGTKLFNSQTAAAKTFQALPLERVFLETDDQLDKSLLDIYEQAARLRKTDENVLREALFSNFERISG